MLNRLVVVWFIVVVRRMRRREEGFQWEKYALMFSLGE